MAVAVEEPIEKQQILLELGTTGLKRYGLRGSVNEEFLPDLSGDRARKVYREMRDNDPVIGAILYAIEMLLRNVSWRVEGEDQEAVEFVESCLDDMSHSWEDFIAEVLSMLPYGFSWHEIVYKRRNGNSRDPSKHSKYDDGCIGWRKLPIRAQDSLQEWVWDEEGGIQAFVQMAPPSYKVVEIPIDRSLLFRTGMHKGNPEGRSILRNAYRPWFFKKTIEEVEAIGIERDLAGLPMFKLSAEAKQYEENLKQILRNVRRDEQEGLIIPLVYDDQGRELIQFELLRSAGNRQIDVGRVVDRYDRRIAMTVLAQFIMLGQSNVGSFALSSSQTSLFATALGALLKTIAGIINRHGIPRLLAVNAIKVKENPYLVPGDVETPDLKELGAYITALAGAGAPLFPDDDLENTLREVANLPPKSEQAQTPISPELAPEAPKQPKKPLPPATTEEQAQNAQEGQ